MRNPEIFLYIISLMNHENLLFMHIFFLFITAILNMILHCEKVYVRLNQVLKQYGFQ